MGKWEEFWTPGSKIEAKAVQSPISAKTEEMQRLIDMQNVAFQSGDLVSYGLLTDAIVMLEGPNPRTVLPRTIVNWATSFQISRATTPQAPPYTAFLDKIEKLKSVEPRKVLMAAPDYVQPIVAWRAWRVSGMKLQSLGRDNIWEPKKAMSAENCRSHEAPLSNCGCGIWSFNTLEELVEAVQGYNSKPVVGTVSLWGRLIQCEHGWRAQYAYPQELWLLSKEHEQLGYLYGVPVRTLEDGK